MRKKERSKLMIMLSGERWHCTNSACRCGVLVEAGGRFQGANPRCTCGAIMKKDYSPPRMNYLDFLQLRNQAASQHVSSEK